MPCHACATLPPPLPRAGDLYVSAREEVLRDSLLAALGPRAVQEGSGVYRLRCDGTDLVRFADSLRTSVGEDALGRMRYVLLPPDDPFDAGVIGEFEPLTHLLVRTETDWLVELIREERLTTHFQPIVHAGEPDRAFAYESLLRGFDPDGSVVSPGRLFGAARDGNLLFNLDRLARLSAIRCAHDAAIETRLFVNFNPTSIYNPDACLGSTFAAAREAKISPDRIVFEVVESERISDKAHLTRICQRYREAGFGVALDDLGSAYGGLDLLQSLRPNFVKLDMGLVRDCDREPFKGRIVAHLLAMARDLGVATVVEGIEREGEAEFAREHGADFLQGYLFGKPAAVPQLRRLARAA